MKTGKCLAEQIMLAIYKQHHGTEFGFVKDPVWIGKIQPLALLFFSRNFKEDPLYWFKRVFRQSINPMYKQLEGFTELQKVLTDYKNTF